VRVLAVVRPAGCPVACDALEGEVQRSAIPPASRSRRRYLVLVRRDLVGTARAAIAEDGPAAAGLLPLADLLGVSPFRLSRAFPREFGISLTRYRDRIRVGRILDRLEEGEGNLSVLAADVGYADQAHLCRTMRQRLGHTPTALRRLLANVEIAEIQ
jgi:AraC-like DNA-binding protein